MFITDTLVRTGAGDSQALKGLEEGLVEGLPDPCGSPCMPPI